MKKKNFVSEWTVKPATLSTLCFIAFHVVKLIHTILDTVVLLAFDSSLLFALLKAARYYSQVKHRHPGPTVVPRRLFNIHF